MVWADERGSLVTAPPSRTEASGVPGAVAALALAGLVFGAGSAVRRELDRRRLGQWDREWALVGPRRGHRTG
ncbi:hypothetical protein ACIP2Y_16155 [Streptomyces sviceus]|uniref:hypothetical protein n=1 Tax=Streptomyces sviceus TaxID=285530 RepID=UPI0037FA94D2